jgi:hypothetical protein
MRTSLGASIVLGTIALLLFTAAPSTQQPERERDRGRVEGVNGRDAAADELTRNCRRGLIGRAADCSNWLHYAHVRPPNGTQ